MVIRFQGFLSNFMLRWIVFRHRHHITLCEQKLRTDVHETEMIKRRLYQEHWLSIHIYASNYTFNSLEPSEAIWRCRSGSTLAQVMACCLTAPSHYLNQYWLIISKVEWYSSKGKFTRDTSAINQWNYLKIKYPKFRSNFPGANELMADGNPIILQSHV